MMRGVVAACVVAGSLAGQAEWSQFRGPGSRGIAAATAALPVEFGPEKNVRWKLEVGPGHSSPCVFGQRVFLTACVDRKLQTLCIDAERGRLFWRKELDVAKVERVHRVNSAASPTPVCDGERVYAYFGSFGLIAYDLEGEEVWRKPLAIERNIFGTATSPIVADGKLIFVRDTNAESYVEVMEAATGKRVWKKDRTGFPSGWSTPVIWTRGDRQQLLVYGAFRLTGYALADGEELWSVPGLADEPCVTPVHGDGLVFVSSYNMNINPEVVGLPEFADLLKQYDTDKNGRLNRKEVEPNKSILSRMDADGEGDHPLRGFFRFLDGDRSGEIDAKEWQKIVRWLNSFEHKNAILAIRPGDGDRDAEIVWQHPRGVPECPSPLYHDGRLYAVKNGGIASCFDAKTGEVKYQQRIGARGPRYSSPVIGDGKIYAASARGFVTVYAVGDELRVLAQNDLGERIMATPALAHGSVFLRTDKHLWAFSKN